MLASLTAIARQAESHAFGAVPTPEPTTGIAGITIIAHIILAGHNRYDLITGLRNDGLSPQILGMNKIISKDALRRSNSVSRSIGD